MVSFCFVSEENMLLINRLDKVTQILRPDFSIFSWIISPIEIKIVKTHQMILFFFSLFFFFGGGGYGYG